MNFLAPGFAAFALLFGVPIAIHLIGRSRAKVKRFAAIDLLLRSEKRVARRTKLRQWLLLAVRALAIAAVPLILAKPFIEAASDLPSAVSASQSAVIVLDDSMSMSFKLGDETLLERAKVRARRIVAAFGRDADAALVLASRGGSAPVPELTPDRGRLERAIGEVVPSDRATDVTGALKRAAHILSTAARADGKDRRIYLLGDLSQHGFERDPPWAAGAGPELVAIDVSDGATLQNRAITDLRVEPAAHLGPRGVRVSVDVANFSAGAVKELGVTLRVDGKPVAKGLLDLAPGQKAQKRFFHTFGPCEPGKAGCDTGVHDVVVELTPDALPDDDRRFQRVEVRPDIRVLVVDGDPRTVRRDDEVFYLETALHPGGRSGSQAGSQADSQLDVTTVTADELGHRRLADFDVVFLCNVKAPLDAPSLREYVEHGGGLFLSLGENVDVDVYNQTLGDLLPQPLQAIRWVREGEQLGRVDKGHPALASLASGARHDEAFREARFTRYALFKPTAKDPDRQVLLHFDSGSPALLEARIGQGRVLLLASSIDRDWTDLPIQPIFLPLVQQATRYLARAPLHEAETPALIGQRHDIPLAEGDQRLEVRLPSGKTRVYEPDKVAGRRAFGFAETDEPGVYHVSAAASEREALRPRPQASFVVNLDPAESDLTRITTERLHQLEAGAGAKKVGQAPRRRVELWHSMGAALLLLLLVEALLLRRK